MERHGEMVSTLRPWREEVVGEICRRVVWLNAWPEDGQIDRCYEQLENLVQCIAGKMTYSWRSLMGADAEQREAPLQVASRCVEETVDGATASLKVSLTEQEQL